MILNNLYENDYGVTTNLMNFIKSYVLCKNSKYTTLNMYSDKLLKLKYICADLEINLFRNKFNNIKELTMINNHLKDKFIKKFVDSDPDGKFIFEKEFPKSYEVSDVDEFNLKIFTPEKIEDMSGFTVFHVKNKNYMEIKYDIEIYERILDFYFKEYKTDRFLFISGCKILKDTLSSKYNIEVIERQHFFPWENRQKGTLDSLLSDIYLASNSCGNLFISNDFLHKKYYHLIQDDYKNIRPEICFYNSINYKKIIFTKDISYSNYFDMFVYLQNKYKFLI